ncbi:MAG TPA: hypothetical protein DDW65_05655 [Firmicutes bacterium]|jgi:hypothetical protein|nr:hypothetical protein [Bacillota bacterium]
MNEQNAIYNYGLINGNIKFVGSGNNTVNNFSGQLVESGLSVDLCGSTFDNSGTLSPGGSDYIQTTSLNGNLIFEDSGPTVASMNCMNASSFGDSDLTDSSQFNIELDGKTTQADRVDVSGIVTLGGALNLILLNPGRVLPGTYSDTILTSSAYTGQFQTFNYRNTAVVNYQLVYDATGMVLNYTVDFAAAGLNGNQTALGKYFNTIQKAGGTDGLVPIVADLVAISDVTALGSAYDQLSPYIYNNTTRAVLNSTGNSCNHCGSI